MIKFFLDYHHYYDYEVNLQIVTHATPATKVYYFINFFFIYRVLLPLVLREVVSVLKPVADNTSTADFSNYGFLYGTIPTAPGMLVFATKYNVAVDMVSQKNSFFALLYCYYYYKVFITSFYILQRSVINISECVCCGLMLKILRTCFKLVYSK